jgi:high-affinity Fe2+/Pb2+ permease
MFVAVPLQVLAIVYVAGILAATSRRSPAANVSLGMGAIAGLAAGLASALAFYALNSQDDRYVGWMLLSTIVATLGLAALAGAAAAWLLPHAEDPGDMQEARLRQGLLAGLVAGAACGMLLTYFFVVAAFMMVVGPLIGAAGGAVGGAVAADHPRRPRTARSWSAGLFVSRGNSQTVRPAIGASRD